MREYFPEDFEHTSEILLATLAPEENGVDINSIISKDGIAGKSERHNITKGI